MKGREGKGRGDVIIATYDVIKLRKEAYAKADMVDRIQMVTFPFSSSLQCSVGGSGRSFFLSNKPFGFFMAPVDFSFNQTLVATCCFHCCIVKSIWGSFRDFVGGSTLVLHKLVMMTWDGGLLFGVAHLHITLIS